MNKISRRAMAAYAADQLIQGASARTVAKNLAYLLVDTGRQNEVEFLIEDIGWELEQNQVLVAAKVTSAQPLAKELQSQIRQLLKQLSGAKEVTVETNIDKAVLGGVRIDTAAKVWDFTAARKLSELREVF